jgi:hypothetical protein
MYVFWCHSIDLKLLPLTVCAFALNISISFRIFRFSRLGVVSLPCEWSWAISLLYKMMRLPTLVALMFNITCFQMDC